LNRQIRGLGIVVIVLFVALVAQLANLQVVQAKRLSHDPRNTREAVSDFSRPRGAIQTADGVVVADSVPANDLFHFQRQYPLGPMFSFVTGFLSFTYGADGIEQTYGPDLAGRTLPVHLKDLRHLLASTPRTANVTLTITRRLQQVATDALGHQVGAVVAIDPRDGAVLAMVSQPTYDPNELAVHDRSQAKRRWNGLIADSGRPMLARAFRERYAPGSTFKVVTAAAVYDHSPDLASRPYPFLDELRLPQTTKTLHNFGGKACGGVLPDLLRLSCDTGFAQIGLDLGARSLTAEAQAFGFAARPPFDLPRPASSAFPDVGAFLHNLPGLAHDAIGQENVAATPLEMALVACAIANQGVIMVPHVMSEIRDSEGNLVRSYKPTAWLQATAPQTAATLRTLMENVVTSGTGTGVALPGVSVAAKTGTAEVDDTHANAWMIAFAPAENPTVAVAAVVPGLTGVGSEVTGGRRAAPIVRAVLAAALGISI